jgi:TPR repeat protein
MEGAGAHDAADISSLGSDVKHPSGPDSVLASLAENDHSFGIAPSGLASIAPLAVAARAFYDEAEALRASGTEPERAVHLYQRAASVGAGSGAADALCVLAKMSERGWDGRSDLARAYELPSGVVGREDDSAATGGVLSRLSWTRLGLGLPRALSFGLLRPSGQVRQALARLDVWGNADGPSTASGSASASAMLVRPDIQAAVDLYNRSAALGNASAQFTMGVLYAHGLFGVSVVCVLLRWGACNAVCNDCVKLLRRHCHVSHTTAGARGRRGGSAALLLCGARWLG